MRDKNILLDRAMGIVEKSGQERTDYGFMRKWAKMAKLETLRLHVAKRE